MLLGARSRSTVQEEMFDIFRDEQIVQCSLTAVILHLNLRYIPVLTTRWDIKKEMLLSRPNDGPSKQEVHTEAHGGCSSVVPEWCRLMANDGPSKQEVHTEAHEGRSSVVPEWFRLLWL